MLCTATMTNAKMKTSQYILQNRIQNSNPFLISFEFFSYTQFAIFAVFAVFSVFSVMHNCYFCHKIIQSSLEVALVRDKD